MESDDEENSLPPAEDFEEETPEAEAEEAEGEEGGEDGEGEGEAAAAVAAPAPAAAGKAKGGPRGKRQIAIPKDSASFFRARKQDVRAFGFTPEGDLQVPEMRGQPAKVIPLPSYRDATLAELTEILETRKGVLAGVEREFDELQRSLKEAIASWRATGATAEVLRIQRDLARLDAQRTAQITPIRWTAGAKGLAVRDILFDETLDKKLKYPVMMLRTRPFLFTETYRPRKEGEEVVAAGEGGAAASPASPEEQEPEAFIVFYSPEDPDHGKLSPETMVEFVYNETKYTSPWQAYEVERITALGRKDARTVLLKSANPKKMRTLANMIKGNVEDPRGLWIGILTALVTQHPEFAEVLRETGKETLVFADPKDTLSGIGMTEEDEQVTERGAWKGQNLLGQAWMAVRTGLPPEGEELASQSGGGYTEHGKTRREIQEERGHVLAGMAKRRY